MNNCTNPDPTVDTAKILYILSGIAGSGKTTLAKKMIMEGKAVNYFEADAWMTDGYGVYTFDPKRLGYCHNHCKLAVEGCMIAGYNTIQSNTNLRRKDVEPYLALAEHYGYTVVIIILSTNYGNIHGVPADKISSMKDLLECFDYTDIHAKVVKYDPEHDDYVEYLN